MLINNKLNKFVVIKQFIHLYTLFFKGAPKNLELLWDVVNNFFLVRIKQPEGLNSSKASLLLFSTFKNHTLLQLRFLTDLTANQLKGAFFPNTLCYFLLSTRFNFRATIYVSISNKFQGVNSVFKLFRSALWLERETWDLFGIVFRLNPDLRRLLTDYGFKDHALQKKFPLSGLIDVFYSDSLKRLLYVPVELNQTPRVFYKKKC